MNIMVTLINIKKTDHMVIANYYLDTNADDIGYIEYDIQNHLVNDYRYCKEDEESHVKWGLSKALRAIELMATRNKFPEKYTYMWY